MDPRIFGAIGSALLLIVAIALLVAARRAPLEMRLATIALAGFASINLYSATAFMWAGADGVVDVTRLVVVAARSALLVIMVVMLIAEVRRP